MQGLQGETWGAGGGRWQHINDDGLLFQGLHASLLLHFKLRGASGGDNGVQGEDDGSTLIEMSHFLKSRRGERPVGVYAIHDVSKQMQYVGYSRNVVLSIQVRAILWARTHILHPPPPSC